MSSADLNDIAREALLLVFWLSLPVFVAALLSGVFTGLLQNFTRISEPTINNVARIAAVFATIAAMVPFAANHVSYFAVRTWTLIQILTSGS